MSLSHNYILICYSFISADSLDFRQILFFKAESRVGPWKHFLRHYTNKPIDGSHLVKRASYRIIKAETLTKKKGTHECSLDDDPSIPTHSKNKEKKKRWLLSSGSLMWPNTTFIVSIAFRFKQGINGPSPQTLTHALSCRYFSLR